jgi:hypothetical protein
MRVRPLVESSWEWFTGDLGAGVSAADNSRITVLSQGFRGDNVVAASATSSSSSTYSLYGSLGSVTISNLDDKTGQWEQYGDIYLAYNSTYRYGRSIDVDVLLKELSKDNPDTKDLENVWVKIRMTFPEVASTTVFNNTVPKFDIEVIGDTKLKSEDFAGLVFSSTTSVKYIRLYVKLKDANTHYAIVPLNRYGRAYNSTRAVLSTSYCYFNYIAGATPLASLPTPAQGDIVYATMKNYATDSLAIAYAVAL